MIPVEDHLSASRLRSIRPKQVKRFAQADADKWAAARASAEGAELELAVEAAQAPVALAPKRKPKLKVVMPEPEPEPDFGDIGTPVFTEELIAKMFANLAAHGMTLQDPAR